MMCTIFNGNPSTKIISCYGPINDSEEMDITTLNNGLSYLIWLIPKYNVLIIGGDMNIQIGKDGNNKFC